MFHDDTDLVLLLDVLDLGIRSLTHQAHRKLGEGHVMTHGAYDLTKQRTHGSQIVVLRVG